MASSLLPTPLQPEMTDSCNALLYIDNSNIFESAKKFSGNKKGYGVWNGNGIPDVNIRIDFGKMIRKVVGDRTILISKLYGSKSTLHSYDSVWAALRKDVGEVNVFNRSTWTLKEKETDSTLTADAVEDIILEKANAGRYRTVIIFSGDRDLKPVVDKALAHGYLAEVWSFSTSFNKSATTQEKENPGEIKVCKLDDYFGYFTFPEYEWNERRNPPERTLVSPLSMPSNLPDGKKKKILEAIVAKAGETFKLPMMGSYMEDFKYIMLAPSVTEFYTPKLCKPCKSKCDKDLAEVRTYNFNDHVYNRAFMLEQHCKQKEVGITLKFKTLFEHRQNRQPRTDDMIELNNSFQGFLPADVVERSNVVDADDFSTNDVGYTIAERKVRKTKQRHPQPKPSGSTCPNKFWCPERKCEYTHDYKEEAYFKENPKRKPEFRRDYKTKKCYYKIENGYCFRQDRPYVCHWAHSLEESRCLYCPNGDGKHWMENCPMHPDNKIES